MAKRSWKHYNAKFLWSEYLDGPDHKREKDQWSIIVFAMPRCSLVKAVEKLLRKSFFRIYEKQTRNPQIVKEFLWKENCRTSFEKSWKEDPQSTIHNCERIIVEISLLKYKVNCIRNFEKSQKSDPQSTTRNCERKVFLQNVES